MKRLDQNVFVAGQIMPADIARLAAAGVKAIINNRPDGEEPGQPSGAEIAAAAQAHGLAYFHIPVATLDRAQVEAMAAALAAGTNPALAFCRSGTRSTYLWALARSSHGADHDELIQAASDAGYDLTPIIRFL